MFECGEKQKNNPKRSVGDRVEVLWISSVDGKRNLEVMKHIGQEVIIKGVCHNVPYNYLVEDAQTGEELDFLFVDGDFLSIKESN